MDTDSAITEPVRRLEVFTGAGRRRTWRDEDKARIVAEIATSGDSVCAVARRHGLSPQQLFGWRRQLRESEAERSKADGLQFVPAVVDGLTPRGHHRGFADRVFANWSFADRKLANWPRLYNGLRTREVRRNGCSHQGQRCSPDDHEFQHRISCCPLAPSRFTTNPNDRYEARCTLNLLNQRENPAGPRHVGAITVAEGFQHHSLFPGNAAEKQGPKTDQARATGNPVRQQQCLSDSPQPEC
jgi:transposase